MKNEIIIKEHKSGDAIPYHLLLMADPSKENVDNYISDSIIYTAESAEGIIGCYVLYELDNNSVEIKNIAVDEKHQNKGIGTLLLQDALEKAKSGGLKEVIIGTGNSSIGQLYLYQKVGFRITDIRANFFRDNYKETIFENGIECIDMIILTKKL